VKWFGFCYADPRCRESFRPCEPSHLSINLALYKYCTPTEIERDTDAPTQMHPPTHTHTHTHAHGDKHTHITISLTTPNIYSQTIWLLQLLRSHKGVASQMMALREQIENDFKKNICAFPSLPRPSIPLLSLFLSRSSGSHSHSSVRAEFL
jgi:hypothetical protein